MLDLNNRSIADLVLMRHVLREPGPLHRAVMAALHEQVPLPMPDFYYWLSLADAAVSDLANDLEVF